MKYPFSLCRVARGMSVLLAWCALVVIAPRGRAAGLAVQMDAIAQRHVAANHFSGAVLVAKRGAVLFDRAYGLANREWDIPNTPTTHFRIGSVTKQFTAVAILLLEERGRLKISDPVSAHLTDAPAAWSRITLHHLLTHTSGIPNVTRDPEFILWKNQPATAVQMVGRFSKQPLEFPPGDRHAYSNSNYLVLGLIVERLTGQRFGEFLQENVLAPLGLKDSGLDSNLRILPRRASGYMRRNDQFLNAPYSDMTVPHAAGAMYSTTHDLWRWAEAIFGERLLTPASRAKLLTPGKGDYALGVRVSQAGGRRRIEHGGSIAGFTSSLDYYPGEGVTVVVLANMSTPSVGLARELAAAVFGTVDDVNPASR